MEIMETCIRAARINITVPNFREGHEELEEILLFLRSRGFEGVSSTTIVPPDNRGTLSIELIKGISPNKEFSRELDRILANLGKERFLKKDEGGGRINEHSRGFKNSERTGKEG